MPSRSSSSKVASLSKQPFIHHNLDQSLPLTAKNGFLHLSGWVSNGTKDVIRVRLNLDESGCFDFETGFARPDVAQAFPSLENGQQSGFQLEAILPLGWIQGRLEINEVGHQNWVLLREIEIYVEPHPLVGGLESSLPLPIEPGHHYVHGWCFHPQSAIKRLILKWGTEEAELEHGAERPDIGEAHPSCPASKNSGFAGHIKLRPGQNPLILQAFLADGPTQTKILIPNLSLKDRESEAARILAWKTRAAAINLPDPGQPPVVSILIPIFNQLDLTLACLESIAREGAKVPFEVIIVDDNSSPEVGSTLEHVDHLKILANETNQGFIYNCNWAAREAVGEYVLFLNNDTQVTSGWLDSLLEVFENRPKAGVVGAKLLYPNGMLQEAGGLIWEDGTGWNFGNDDDPELPEYNYLRQVDFCSGACLLIPRKLFWDVGGFDERYRPAYFEDVDLAFAVRKADREVYYQPQARIIHFEGASSGTDTRQGVKRHQVINREKFLIKWGKELAKHGADSSSLAVARDRFVRGRVLVIDACALTPDQDAGSVRMFHLLEILATAGCKVTFAAENLQFHEPYSTRLQAAGVEHLGVPYQSSVEVYLEKNAYAFDLVILSRKFVAGRFTDVIRRSSPRTKIIFDTVDLQFLRLQRQADLEKSAELAIQAKKSYEEELALIEKTDLTYVVSPIEKQILTNDVPEDKIALVPLIQRINPSKTPADERNGLLFVGGFQHPPNLDAVEHFLDEIFPLVQEKLPNVLVHIVGSKTPDRLRKRANDQIRIHGFVESLDDLFDQIKINIAPLRFGAGAKGKVNDSLARGVPTVATSVATEGMHLLDGESVLVGDDSKAFADAVVRLHTHDDLWERLSRAGIENIERHTSFAAVRRQLFESFNRLLPDFFRPGRALPERVVPHYPIGEVLNFGEDGDVGEFLENGWSEPHEGFRWVIGRKARIRMRWKDNTAPSHLICQVFPLLIPGKISRQRIRLISPRGATPSDLELTESGPQFIKFALPKSTTSTSRILSFQFEFPDAVAPRDLELSEDARPLSAGFLSLQLR